MEDYYKIKQLIFRFEFRNKFKAIFGTAKDARVTILNCYNRGNVSTTSGAAGGIAGAMVDASATELTIKNCYTTGTISKDNNYGGIIGVHNAGTYDIKNSYWLNTLGVNWAVGKDNTTPAEANLVKAVSVAQLRTMAETLKGAETENAFKADIPTGENTWKYNDGYPILKWQDK